MSRKIPKFELGCVVVTPTASQVLLADGQSADLVLSRHQSGDWGEVSDHERQLNNEAVKGRANVLSIYKTRTGQRVTIVTKADRSMTLVHVDPRC